MRPLQKSKKIYKSEWGSTLVFISSIIANSSDTNGWCHLLPDIIVVCLCLSNRFSSSGLRLVTKELKPKPKADPKAPEKPKGAVAAKAAAVKTAPGPGKRKGGEAPESTPSTKKGKK